MILAMWSGPRNLSTAMMYAFGNRSDFHVVDEPFYAAYLARTDFEHPMRSEILASQSQDPRVVIEELTGPVPGNRPHAYHKHMSQHMIAGIPRDWIGSVANVFLIRHPARVVASFAAKYQNPTLPEIGFIQQVELYRQLVAEGHSAHVIDSADIRAAPELMLKRLCAALGIAFDPAMLSWPTGGHAQDGVWAPVWYDAVHNSTGFAGPEGPLPVLGRDAAALADAAMPAYEELAKDKI
ncbi:branched-chain amino acid aminotransferase [Roseivivax halodurans JCM 10272]|uniref:Branched-chain amino acid aminotransferase n=1 Tax=Roseivivax halodurans JCM 10272 TaxID=1449350 RepID=X7EGH2_9RHOB|nr:sulfotransferase family protein [Roseivivax halodurans]ETX15017.1 branched-chain amino acid aminotransferase [Roseivivax halodurans JCM 10272]